MVVPVRGVLRGGKGTPQLGAKEDGRRRSRSSTNLKIVTIVERTYHSTGLPCPPRHGLVPASQQVCMYSVTTQTHFSTCWRPSGAERFERAP